MALPFVLSIQPLFIEAMNESTSIRPNRCVTIVNDPDTARELIVLRATVDGMNDALMLTNRKNENGYTHDEYKRIAARYLEAIDSDSLSDVTYAETFDRIAELIHQAKGEDVDGTR